MTMTISMFAMTAANIGRIRLIGFRMSDDGMMTMDSMAHKAGGRDNKRVHHCQDR